MNKDNIVLEFASKEQAKMLEQDPSVVRRKFLDLTIIYKEILSDKNDYVVTKIVKNSDLQELGLTELELFYLAYEQTFDKRGVDVISLPPISLINPKSDIEYENIQMYILTNELGLKGAINIVYKDVLDSIAEDFEDDLIIFPVSVHECVFVKRGAFEFENFESLNETLGNNDEIDENEQLSNQIYLYNHNSGCLIQVTNKEE